MKETQMSRECRCSICGNPEKDAAKGVVASPIAYGDMCGNCGYYSPLRADCSEGHCRKFGVRKHRQGMGLIRRNRGDLPQGALPLIVGGAYYCGDYRPLHDKPAPDDPLMAVWVVGA